MDDKQLRSRSIKVKRAVMFLMGLGLLMIYVLYSRCDGIVAISCFYYFGGDDCFFESRAC